MPRYVFQMEIREGQGETLAEFVRDSEPQVRAASQAIEGFRSMDKFVLGDRYVEIIDVDGAFDDFGRQLSADPEVRQFLRQVWACFVQSPREMDACRMQLLQSIRPAGE